jgi:hypothetical protein
MGPGGSAPDADAAARKAAKKAAKAAAATAAAAAVAAAVATAAAASGDATAKALNFKDKPDLKALSVGLPPGWIAMWDKVSGDVYYGNPATKVMMSVCAAAASMCAAAASNCRAGSFCLPTGWALSLRLVTAGLSSGAPPARGHLLWGVTGQSSCEPRSPAAHGGNAVAPCKSCFEVSPLAALRPSLVSREQSPGGCAGMPRAGLGALVAMRSEHMVAGPCSAERRSL